MTAFARLQAPTYAWEIRSVNHRSLEIRLKIPDAVRELEARIKEDSRRVLQRGYVEIFFHEQPAERTSESEILKLNEAVPEAIEQIVSALPNKTVVNVVDVTRLLLNPEILRSRSVDTDYDLDILFSTFQECLKQFLEAREREGKALQSIISKSATTVRSLLAKVETLGEEQPKIIQERLLERLHALDKQVDPNRVAQEVALLAQKSDFKEEQDRITIHLEDLEQCLSSSNPVGRRLNFLTQEILREANTLAVKVQVPDCTTLLIDLKVCVDQMREQVQNIE